MSGTIDELFRHCNTKLCRYHFVSSDHAADRVIALGERPDDVFVIGSPELDVHGQPSGVALSDVRSRYDIEFEEYGIVVFHPVTSEQATMGLQARQLFGALERSGREFVVISPNNDPGSAEIRSVIDGLPSSRFRRHTFDAVLPLFGADAICCMHRRQQQPGCSRGPLPGSSEPRCRFAAASPGSGGVDHPRECG